MLPKCKKTDIVEVLLAEDMTLDEVEQFITDFRTMVGRLEGAPFHLLNNATNKSFADLAAVKVLSVGMRSVLSESNVKRVAVVRPQNDYINEESINKPDLFQIFENRHDAKRWLFSGRR